MAKAESIRPATSEEITRWESSIKNHPLQKPSSPSQAEIIADLIKQGQIVAVTYSPQTDLLSTMDQLRNAISRYVSVRCVQCSDSNTILVGPRPKQ
jgi:hypothetical protein